MHCFKFSRSTDINYFGGAIALKQFVSLLHIDSAGRGLFVLNHTSPLKMFLQLDKRGSLQGFSPLYPFGCNQEEKVTWLLLFVIYNILIDEYYCSGVFNQRWF